MMSEAQAESGSTRNLILEETEGDEVDGVVDEQIEESMDPTWPARPRRSIARERGGGRSSDVGKWRTLLGYSVGHFYNDLCASMWFTYLMLFMEKVLQMNSFHAGFLMLVGQVTDAMSTPLVGLMSDASFLPTSVLERFGRRKSWHLLGTLCVTLSFPFIFNRCFLCSSSSGSGPDGAGATGEWWRMLWFIPPIMLFQFGWASCQISHLALIPELTRDEARRTSMNSFRYGFTVLANLSVFGLLYWLLNEGGEKGGGEGGVGPSDKLLLLAMGSGGSWWEEEGGGKRNDTEALSKAIDPSDLSTFSTVDLVAVGTGLTTSLLFWLSVREPRNARTLSRANSFSSETSVLIKMSWKNWFSQMHFYQTAVLYTFSRLYINISQVYFPFYITQTQERSKEYVAILPMLAYCSSLAVSLLLGISAINRRVGRKLLFLVGAGCSMLNCFLLYFPLPGWRLFPAAGLLGLNQAILLISSLQITANLINRNTESSAFVYGAMSFLDKFSNGATVQVVEILNPTCSPSHTTNACSTFYRDVMVFIPGVSALCIFLTLLTIDISKLGQRRLAVTTLVDHDEGEEGEEENVVESQHGTREDPTHQRGIAPYLPLVEDD